MKSTNKAKMTKWHKARAKAPQPSALVHLRLQTLPWIAKLMASDLPESSLEGAERCALRAVALRPSRENRLILAKVLLAAGRDNDARTVIDAALGAAAKWPRDAALEASLRDLRP